MFNLPLMNYMRGFQSKIISKNVQHPNISLGIQEAEKLSNVSKIKYPNIIQMKATIPDLESESYERTQIDGYSRPLTSTDFQNTGQLGASVWE